MPPLVSVVVLTYQSARHLPDLLHSLRAQTLRNFELVHMDSASLDATCAKLAHHWPDLRPFWSAENLGYRRGNQRGMEMALGKYILVLNDDVELHPRLLEELVATAEADPRIAVVAPAILMHGSSSRLNAAGSALMPAGFYAARAKAQSYEAFREPADLVAASGCCFLLRRSFLKRGGGFAPVFDSLPSGWHASAEDLDLCWRAWAEGWRVRYQPRAVLWHKYAQKQLDPARFTSLLSGRLVFVCLNYPTSILWRLAPVLLATECAVAAYCAVRGARFLRAWWSCWSWAWRSRRRLAELRAVRLSQGRRPHRELLALMSPSLVLAPDLQRNWLVRAGCWAWFGWNALWLGWRSSPVRAARVYSTLKRLADIV
ncbi:MAG: glycosyltransferase family 2 protein, partial [Bryobacterales bacterium]|nr:glycosyltransferase family 2 protein [Bryobacterales bacterium]